MGGFLAFSLIVTIAYLFGFLAYLTGNDKNRCAMTYMFQYPQFVKIETDYDWKFKKYGLYAYSEGFLTERARNMVFGGIPVLFIPGNSGSFRQVRSLASVSLRKSLEKRHGYHFDFFTLNLNQELSGLNGALLNEQTEYANFSVSRILELYSKKSNPPKSIILVGHSMGGVIARGLLTILPKGVVVPLIITLATPHARLPIFLDTYMVEYYKKIEVESVNSTILSVAGGYNDLLVLPFFTHTNKSNYFQVASTGVPRMWLSVDHLCILWCNQLVLSLTRTLFDLVDKNTKQFIINKDIHHRVFNHHFIKNSGSKVALQPYNTGSINFKAHDGNWIENLQEQYSIVLPKGTKATQWHMIRLINQPEFEFLTILTQNLEVDNWVFACSADHLKGQHRICENGTNLSHLSEIVPTLNVKRRILNVNLQELKKTKSKITHVVVKILPTSEKVIVNIDRYNPASRKVKVNLPQWYSLSSQIIIEKTEEKVVHYELTLLHLQHIIQSFRLHIVPIKCSNSSHHATANLEIPWTNQHIHKIFTEDERTSFNLRIYVSKPTNANGLFSKVTLTLDPICTYTVKISNSPLGMLSQIARIYSPLLIANMAAVILLTFRNQLTSIDTSQTCSLFFIAIKQGVKPYYILTMVKLLSKFLSWHGFTKILPLPDWQLISDEGNNFFLLPLVLYMCSVGFVWIFSISFAISLVIYESSFHRIASKFIAKTVSGFLKLSDWIIDGFQKLPCVVGGILVMLSITACGSLALCLGCAFYFLKLAHMSQEYFEQVNFSYVKRWGRRLKKLFRSKDQNEDVKKPIEPSTSKDNEVVVDNKPPEVVELPSPSPIFFHFTIFLLWCIVAALNVPYILTWAHNFGFSNSLKPDPSFLPGLILSVCAIPLWQLDFPRINLCWYESLCQILNLVAMAALLYAPISVYRLVYIITATIVLITMHQLLAPTKSDEEITTETETPSPLELLNELKSKME